MKHLRFLLSVTLLSLALSSPGLAWNPTEMPPGFVVETPGSPVVLGGKPLFYLRVKPKAQSTEQEAHMFAERIKQLAGTPRQPPNHHRAGFAVEFGYHGRGSGYYAGLGL